MSVTGWHREWFRKLYDVDESKGDEIHVALDPDGVLHVRVAKFARADIPGIQCSVTFKELDK